MKTLLAIKQKNEDLIFSHTYRSFKRKDLLFSSASLSNFPQPHSIIELNFPKSTSINITTTPKTKSSMKQIYLSYLNNRSHSFKDIKASTPSFSSFKFPKKQINLKMNNNNFRIPTKERSTTQSSNKSFDKYPNEFNEFNTIIQRFNKENYENLTKRLIFLGSVGNKEAQKQQQMQKMINPKKKAMNQLVIHNIFLQGLMTEVKPEMDTKNQLHHNLSENYIKDHSKEDLKNSDLNLIKRNKIENAEKYIDTINKKALKEIGSKKFSTSKNKGIESYNHYQNVDWNSNYASNDHMTSDNNMNINERNNNCEFNLDKDSKKTPSIDEHCGMIQPTKNEKMKEQLDSKNKRQKQTTEKSKKNNAYDNAKNVNESDHSLNEDLLNEYNQLNTNIQEQIINENYKKNQTHSHFFKNALDKHIEEINSNKPKKKKLTFKLKLSESIDKKLLNNVNKKNAHIAIKDFLGTQITHPNKIRRNASGYLSFNRKQKRNPGTKIMGKEILSTEAIKTKNKKNTDNTQLINHSQANKKIQCNGSIKKLIEGTADINIIELNKYIY